VMRNAADLDPDLLKAVFEMEHPAKGAETSALVPMQKGRYALVVLGAVTPGDPSKVPAEAQGFLREQMARAYGAADIEAFLDVLRSKAKIETAPQRL